MKLNDFGQSVHSNVLLKLFVLAPICLLFATHACDFNAGDALSEVETLRPTKLDSSVVQTSNFAFDLGLLTSVDPPCHVFNLENPFDKFLIVDSVNKSCGCIDCDLKVGDVIPGGSFASVKIGVSSNRTGKQVAIVTVNAKTEHHQSQSFVLRLDAEIEPEIWTLPPKLDLDNMDAQSLQLCFRREQDQKEYSSAESVRGNINVCEVERGPGFIRFMVEAVDEPKSQPSFDAIVFRFSKEQYPKHQTAVTLLAHHSSQFDTLELQ